MKEFLALINSWKESSTPFALATVIKTWGSSPRPVGSTMIISVDGEMTGSVSGGCVEGLYCEQRLSEGEKMFPPSSGFLHRENGEQEMGEAWKMGFEGER